MDFDQNKLNPQSLVALLYTLAKEDNTISDKELVYLLFVGDALGLSSDEVRNIIQQPENHPFKSPTSESERMTVLYYLLFLMKSDGIVSLREIQMVQRISFNLGINSELTDRLLAVLKEHEQSVLPKDALIKEIRAYLN